MNNYKSNITITLLALLMLSASIRAAEWTKVVNLKGYWKFSIGDDMKWADPDYDDSDWEEIGVPSSWESEGFHGYNGYAWYRRDFNIPEEVIGFSLKANLGFIDDVDEVYLNGKLIGKSGDFPPNYNTAYNSFRAYPIPQDYVNKGSNYIAVRVFDAQLDGGIISGDIGIFAYTQGMKLDINLEGEWKFKLGDNLVWKEVDYDDSDWSQIIVPGTWETRGWQDYDGYAWYRITIEIPYNFDVNHAVLVLGRIDDLDEAFVNGEKVGATGQIYDDQRRNTFDREYQQFRGYYIPRGVLKSGSENVIAVRVYDGYMDGGIYDGPIGLISQENYREYWKNRKKKKNIWDIIFGN